MGQRDALTERRSCGSAATDGQIIESEPPGDDAQRCRCSRTSTTRGLDDDSIGGIQPMASGAASGEWSAELTIRTRSPLDRLQGVADRGVQTQVLGPTR